MLEFISQYRQIAKISELQKEEVKIEPFLQNIKQLFSETIKENRIDFQIRVSSVDLKYYFDKKLIEQVIINLIKNSIESLENSATKKVMLVADGNKKSLLIKVQDNGDGIIDEIKDDIFIPFFTTKKQGSGIGLSLSKEIMQKHNGDIYFESSRGKGTEFSLKF